MRIIITGDRFWACHKLAANILHRLVKRYGPDIVIVHGGATGVDESFETACKGLGIKAKAHPVSDEEWRRLGKRAGPLRNGRMVADGADLCIAVHRYVFNSNVVEFIMWRSASPPSLTRATSTWNAT
jgi:hypothetical protein